MLAIIWNNTQIYEAQRSQLRMKNYQVNRKALSQTQVVCDVLYFLLHQQRLL